MAAKKKTKAKVEELSPQSLMEAVPTFMDRVDQTGDCWIWQGAKFNTGYGEVHVGHSSVRRMLAHRFSFQIHNNVILERTQFVCHTCDTRLCVRPDHLFLGDQKINAVDATKKGRLGKKIDQETAFEIRRLYESGVRGLRLSALYPDLSRTALHKIGTGKWWPSNA